MKATFLDNLLLPLTVLFALAAVTTFDTWFSDTSIWQSQSCRSMGADDVRYITSGGCAR